MLCQECGGKPATVHITRVVNGEKSEVNLCEECAQKYHYKWGWGAMPAFSLNKFLAGLLEHDPFWQAQVEEETVRAPRCPTCGLTLDEFSQSGKLGCGDCYEAFAGRLQPLLKRVHGATEHAGKAPGALGEVRRKRRELDRLREHLRQLVAREEFEEAARVRDQIRQLEQEVEG